MPDILVKDLPAKLHRKLKEAAKKNRRSMTQQAIVLLEQGLQEPPKLAFPKPVKTKRPLTQRVLTQGIKDGRA